MIKQILVGLDGSDYGDIALQHGLSLATACQGILHGLHVVDIVQAESPLLHDIAGSIGAAPQFNLTALMRDNLEYRGQQLLEQFRQTCEVQNISHVEHLATGIVSTEIARISRDVDLVIVGRGGVHTSLTQALLGTTAESVVRSGVRVTMVTHQNYRELRRLLVATDGSPASMAALDIASEFAQLFNLPVSVVHCNSTSSSPPDFLRNIEQELEVKGIRSDVDCFNGNPHADLHRYVVEREVDLLFMGAFGHRRIVEWLLGSTSQYMLQTASIPLVLCHADLNHRAD